MNGTSTTFSFSRPYVTTDDVEIVDAEMYLLFAVGPKSGTSLRYHSSERYISPATCLSMTCGMYIIQYIIRVCMHNLVISLCS